MTTIDFLKKNSSNFIEQELWEEQILINKYDDTIIKNNEDNYNNFSKNTLNEGDESYEFKLKRLDKSINYFNYTIDNLKLDTINDISLKIKVKENIDFHKLYLLTIMIQISFKINKDIVYLAFSGIFDMCIQSYIKNKKFSINNEDDNNCINIPIVNYAHLQYGYPYKKQKINITLYNEIYTMIYNLNFIEDVSIIFSGRRYNNFKEIYIKSDQYNYMDVDTNIVQYNKYRNMIVGLCVLSTFIGFTLIRKFKNISKQDIEEYLDNQVQIKSVSLQYKNKEPWIYNLDYMKKIKLYGLDVYILPLFPEYCNFNNILYHLRYTESFLEGYIESINIKIELEQDDNNEYDLYINFYGKSIE